MSVSFTSADAEVSLTNIFSYILGSGLVLFWKSQRNPPNGFIYVEQEWKWEFSLVKTEYS